IKPEGESYYSGTKFFREGKKFHRIVLNDLIQAGSPDESAETGPGYTFPNEIHPDLRHDRAGILGIVGL
ncbi:unnamed protein product, partial [marine sediment metagenome]